MGEGWLFRVARRDRRGRVAASAVRGAGIPDDLQVRVPSARALRDKKVLLIGCGAIGSFVACELARAGVGGLDLLDKDVLEPGNSVRRSEEHTSELQSLMRTPYAVFCLKKTKNSYTIHNTPLKQTP